MPLSARDRKRLAALAKSKNYRDSYVSSRARSLVAFQIQALRHQLGLSQDEFAQKCGLKQSAVSRLENPEYGTVTVNTILQIALALDIAALVLFCSYPEFLDRTSDVSPGALEVEDIHKSDSRFMAIRIPTLSSNPTFVIHHNNGETRQITGATEAVSTVHSQIFSVPKERLLARAAE